MVLIMATPVILIILLALYIGRAPNTWRFTGNLIGALCLLFPPAFIFKRFNPFPGVAKNQELTWQSYYYSLLSGLSFPSCQMLIQLAHQHHSCMLVSMFIGCFDNFIKLNFIHSANNSHHKWSFWKLGLLVVRHVFIDGRVVSPDFS